MSELHIKKQPKTIQNMPLGIPKYLEIYPKQFKHILLMIPKPFCRSGMELNPPFLSLALHTS